MKTNQRTIRKVQGGFSPSLLESSLLQATLLDLELEDWTIVVANQTHGWTRCSTRQIVIPQFAINLRLKMQGYLEWYAAHEFSHAIVGVQHQHNGVFMTQLKHLLDRRYWHYETGYKPRNAQAAGISHLPNHTALRIGNKVCHINDSELAE